MIKNINKFTVSAVPALLTAFLVTTFLTASCATNPGVYREIDHAVEKENFQAAVEVITERQESKKVIYPAKNAVMLFLDKGLLEHYAGNYTVSSDDLQNAERLIEEAYTKSISEGFFSYILNDNTKEYPGEDFEDIYINIFNALNYYNRGSIEGALVEIRKLSMSSGKLDMLARKYDYKDPKTGASLNEMAKRETGVNQLPQAKTVNFSNSALARFLTVLFYQSQGNDSDARIELEQLQRAFSANNRVYHNPVPKAVEEAQAVPAGKARLNIISFTGLSPIKEEERIIYPIYIGNGAEAFIFRLPKLVKRPSLINRIEVIVNGKDKFELELLEDMGAVIEETFAVRYSNIVLKTYIRTSIKYATAAVAGIATAERQGDLAGLLVGFAAKKALETTERADTRMSRYLPDRAYIGGINLDPGTYSVIINYYNGGAVVAQAEYDDVIVKPQGLNLLESVVLK